ncbi:hypothetical protein NC653_029992 [Populus alba x Populus x berolinensis]|uniref:Uncharacterized protein n=1 Tax=Populus alba x Populus x berolinensis TaxID=444605 RepID=A0AAD6M413_9ROSI|nr:hypothetical protein NC653_029992 [Populus alba x Populus x berolinensis]
METATQNPPQHCIKDPVDSPANTNITISDHHDLLPQLQSLQQSFDTIQSKSSLMEENLLLQHERDDALRNNSQLNLVIQEVSKEREPFRDQFLGETNDKLELEKREQGEKWVLVKNHYAFSKAYEGFFGTSKRVFSVL